MADSIEEIQKAKRTYIFVFLGLLCGTIATVLVATVPQLDVGRHGFDMWDCILGLSIATIKATLVAYYFMHLNHEKKAVYWLFGGSFITVASLAGLTAFAIGNPIFNKFFY